MTQDQASDILAMGHNVFLTGAAGSGKTYLVNRFVQHCHEHGIVVAITASTGIAATHIGGMTIHSWSGMGIRDTLTDDDIDDIVSREYLMKRFAKTAVLIIDEVSMISGELLSNLDRILRSARVSPEPFGGMQVVLVGDFFQLPPVSREREVEFAFEHPAWKTWNLAICALTTQYRQTGMKNEEGRVKNIGQNSGLPRHSDEGKIQVSETLDPSQAQDDRNKDSLLQILNEIRAGKVSEQSRSILASRDIPVETEDHTELFTRNVSVDAYNTDRLNSIAGDVFLFEMIGKGPEKLLESLKKGCLAPETLVLKIGARVMFVKNNFEEGYVNGSLGHIVGRHEGLPIVELLDGSRVVADYASWSIEENGRAKAEIAQIPLRLAWAITVHKSQGMTLDSAVMDLSDAFVPGQGYVALSRIRTLDGLILRGYNSIALQIDSRVQEYDRVIQAVSVKTTERIDSIPTDEKKSRIEQAVVRLGGSIEKSKNPPLTKGGKKGATHEETYLLLKQRYSIDEIATIRGLKSSTIVSHIEKLIGEGADIDIEPFRPDDEVRLANILDAFDRLQTENLAPVREYLMEQYDEEYDYDEVRLARLFLGK